MKFTWLIRGRSRNDSDVVPVELPLFTRANTFRALSEASSELVYTTKLVGDRWCLIQKHRVLTSTKAEEKCDINVGVGSSENLRVYVKMLGVKEVNVPTDIKEARAQRLHGDFGIKPGFIPSEL